MGNPPVPGQFVMHPKDNVAGTNDDIMGTNDIAAGKNDIVVKKNDIAAGTNHIVTCFHELVTVLSRIVTFPSEGEVIVKMMKIKKLKTKGGNMAGKSRTTISQRITSIYVLIENIKRMS